MGSQRFMFKQACVIGKTEYANNKVQEVPEEDLTHPYFQQLMKAGKIVEPSGSAQILPESVIERGQRLADSFAKKAEEKKAAAEKAAAEKEEADKKKASEGGEDPEKEIDDPTGEVPPVDGHDEAPESEEPADEEASEEEEKSGKSKKSKKHKNGK